MHTLPRRELTSLFEFSPIKWSSNEFWYYDSPDCYAIEMEAKEESDKQRIIEAAINALLMCSKEYYLFPKHNYFCCCEEKDYWSLLGHQPLKDEVIVWAETDIPYVASIISTHFQEGWNVRWDLYLVSKTKDIFVLIDHHDELMIETPNIEHYQKMVSYLNDIRVPFEMVGKDA